MKVFWAGAAVSLSVALGACDQSPSDQASLAPASETTSATAPVMARSDELVTYTEERELCLDRNPTRNAYFGDLHVHTTYSFDAWAGGVRTTPEQAYAFAQGHTIDLRPTRKMVKRQKR